MLDKTESWFSAPTYNINLLLDVVVDGFHPGVSAQADMAEQMFNTIKKEQANGADY